MKKEYKRKYFRKCNISTGILPPTMRLNFFLVDYIREAVKYNYNAKSSYSDNFLHDDLLYDDLYKTQGLIMQKS